MKFPFFFLFFFVAGAITQNKVGNLEPEFIWYSRFCRRKSLDFLLRWGLATPNFNQPPTTTDYWEYMFLLLSHYSNIFNCNSWVLFQRSIFCHMDYLALQDLWASSNFEKDFKHIVLILNWTEKQELGQKKIG